MKKIITILLSIVIIMALFTGCGASYSTKDSGYYNSADSYYDYGAADGISPSNYDQSKTSETSAPSENKTSDTDLEDFLSSQKLIYTCRVNLETLKFDETVSRVKELIHQYHGFIETDEVSDTANDWYYSSYRKDSGTLKENLTIRIPTENYGDFVSGIDGVGKILSKNETVDNITKNYNDTATTIESLKIQEARLLEMMEKAETIQEMITVESRLSEIQRQLERYQSSLSNMDTDIAFSTVYLTIREVVEYSPEVTEVSYGERFIKAVKESFSDFSNFMQDFSILLVHMFPFLVLMGIIALIVVLIVKASSRKKKKKKQQLEKPVEPIVSNVTVKNPEKETTKETEQK